MTQRLPAKSPASMAGIGPKPQDVETPMSTRARGEESGRQEREPRTLLAPVGSPDAVREWLEVGVRLESTAVRQQTQGGHTPAP
jgi:hypothetical protein